ncbi:hypothetical protein N172_12185 [Pantoea dispersa EGD-AAK13]|nr:hypothetical protein N172_12185 [Pantoea dispersa EGD-AAK13]
MAGFGAIFPKNRCGKSEEQKVREARSVNLFTHGWPDVKAHSGKLRQNLRFVPGADIHNKTEQEPFNTLKMTSE